MPRRLLPLFAVFALSCGGVVENVEDLDEEGVEVPEDKVDNYLSTTGKEYDITGTDTVTVESSYTGDAARARAVTLIENRFKALSWFVYQYVTDKEHEEANASYGGYSGLVRQASFDDTSMRAKGGGVYEYDFKGEIAGPNTMLSGSWIKRDSAGRYFDLKLPVLSNEELVSGSFAKTYKAFDPSKLAADKLETKRLRIAVSPPSVDAYPDYAAMFADKKLDAFIMVGGDYNADRYDLKTARALFDELKKTGFKAPAATYEELKIDSGAFTKTIKTPQGDVAVNVTLLHPDIAGDQYQKLVDAYKAAAKTHDLVIYDGHAGYDSTYSGVVVKYNPRVAIKADDFATLELASKYQVFVFNGCKTYGMYADKLYKNPAKTTKNLDVLSTVNFSWLAEMTRITSTFVNGLAKTTAAGHHPLSWTGLLSEMNRGQSYNVMYGVHGLDDNPRLSPWADPAITGKTCTSAATCGASDSVCVKPTGASCRVCAPACTDNSGCPTGYRCSAVATTGTIKSYQCVPRSRPQCR